MAQIHTYQKYFTDYDRLMMNKVFSIIKRWREDVKMISLASCSARHRHHVVYDDVKNLTPMLAHTNTLLMWGEVYEDEWSASI